MLNLAQPAQRQALGLALGLFLVGSASSHIYAEEPYVLWATSATSSWGASTAALSPTGELYVYAAANSPLGLLQFNPSGTIVATNELAGIYLAGMTFDAKGNRYMTGRASATDTLATPQPEGFFVAKHDSRGELVWVRDAGELDPSATSGTAIAVDAQGNVYVGGQIRGPATQGEYAVGDTDGVFLQKYSKDGQLLWKRRLVHQNSGWWYGATIYDLSVDPTGHVVICGYLSPGTTDFGTETLYPDSTGHSYDGDWFLARFKPNGDLHWVQLGYATSVATDRNGNIYAAFDWAKDGMSGLVKLNPAGELIWSRDFSPAYMAWPGGIAMDPKDEPVFTGEFEGTVDFDNVRLRSRSTGWADFFAAKADAQGEIQWAMSGGGTEFDRGNRVLCDSLGNIYLTGVIRKSRGTFDGWPLVPKGSDSPTIFAAMISPTPVLRIDRVDPGVSFSWPAKATNYVLEASAALVPGQWTPVNPASISTSAGRQSFPAAFDAPAQFFRLSRTP